MNQHPRWLAALVLERVRNAPRSLDEGTGLGYHLLASELEGDLAFQHEEGLILAVMDVRRRAATGQHSRLAQGVSSGRLLTGGKNAVTSPTAE